MVLQLTQQLQSQPHIRDLQPQQSYLNIPQFVWMASTWNDLQYLKSSAVMLCLLLGCCAVGTWNAYSAVVHCLLVPAVKVDILDISMRQHDILHQGHNIGAATHSANNGWLRARG